MVPVNLDVTEINLQHCKEASGVLNHLLCQKSLNLTLIQEPWIYRGTIRGLNIRGGNIFYDTTSNIPRTCIVTTGAVTTQRLVQFTSRDLTAVLVTHRVGGIAKTIVSTSAYLPYDSSDLPPSKKLADLVEYCKEQERPLLVGCDTNAHHICWGSSNTNRRGEALLEYLITTDLDILNTGKSPTFVVSNRQEVTDISLASNELAQEIINLKVTDEESLSDHRHIHFSLQSDRPQIPAWHNSRTTCWDSFKENLRSRMGGRMTSLRTVDVGREVSVLQTSLVESFTDNSKERRKVSKRGAIWWHHELETLRKKCNRISRRARRNQLDWSTAKKDRRKSLEKM